MRLMLAAFLALASTPALASPLILDCKINAGAAQGGYVTSQYVFKFDEEANKVLVVDALIQQEKGGPMAAKIASTNDKRVDFAWQVPVTDVTGNHATMIYKAVFMKAAQTMTVSANVGGGSYRGSFSANGNCTVKKSK